ncbi:MAG: hypothetical protein JXQ29_08345 [Planctomycetes bacterium]|nr:hypothetical protein [Planctomycetota bacterium]
MRRSFWRLGPLVLLLTSALEAQPIEVPLTWSLRPDEGRTFFPLGFARLEKSLTAPEGWKLPPLASSIPAFAKLRLGDRDLLFVLDRSDPKQPFYDRLLFDRNGNGDLTDDPPLDADAARGQRGGFNADRKVWFYHATFTSPRVEIPVDGNSQPYAFRVTAYYSSGRGPAREDAPPSAQDVADGLQLNLMTHFAYTGTFTLNGRTYHVLLGDHDANGRIGERPAAERKRGVRNDLLYVAPTRTMTYYDGFVIGDYLGLEGGLYAVDLQPSANKLTLTPRTEGGGRIALGMEVDRLVLVTPDGAHRVMVCHPGPTLPVPAGRYRIESYRARRKDDGGNTWTVRAQGDEKAPVVEVSPAGEARLGFGEPYRPTAVPTAGPSGSSRLELRVLGTAGERVVGLDCAGEAASRIARSPTKKNMAAEPTYRVLGGDGKVVAEGAFRYG